jgi:large subunit ribosomal protein L17
MAGKKLGRNQHQRQALFRSLLRAVLTHGKIVTTKAKAQAIIPFVESVVNQIVKSTPLLAQRSLGRYISDKHLVSSVYSQVKSAFDGVTMNFTKLVPVGLRQGDNSVMVELSLTKQLVKPVVIAPTKVKKTKKIPPLKEKTSPKVEERVSKIKKAPAKKAAKKS